MRTAALLCLLALAATGCTSAPRDSADEFRGEERKVAAAVEQLEQAARADDADAVCEKLLTKERLELVAKLGTNCRTGVRDAFQDADSFDITVDDVTIRGDAATAKVTSGRGSREKTDTIELKREGSTWKVDSLAS